MVHLVTYDLRKPGRDYSKLYESIKSFGSWAHPVESVWCIDIGKSPAEVRDHLKGCIDANDVLFVVQMHQNWASSNFSNQVVEWLKDPRRSW